MNNIDENYVGDTITLSTQIKDNTNGTLVDPDDITLTIWHKETLTSQVIPKTNLSKIAVGKYQYDYVPSLPGSYIYSFKGTGANSGIDYEAFVVKKSPTGV